MQIPSDQLAATPDEFLTQIVESDAFRSAPMMRTLLMYLWAHSGEPISEYAVAVDALGRPGNFDPKADSTVRVQISRLRAKLKEFYEINGDSFPLKLAIPLGQHDLQWTYEVVPARSSPKGRTIPRSYAIVFLATLGVLLAACIALLLRVRTLESSMPAAQPLPRFWNSLVTGSRPVEVVIPSPVYSFWPDHGINIRDLSVSEFSKWETSPFLREIAAKWGAPQLAQNYVGAPEMNGGIRLLQYLHDRAPVNVIESRRFAADSVAAQNTIFLG